MKNITHIIFSLMILVFAGCQSENVEDINFDTSQAVTTITAGFDTDAKTRVAISGTTITWTDSDLIYVVELDEESGAFTSLMEFEIVPSSISNDGTTASFQAANDDDYFYFNKQYIVVSGRGVTIDSNGRLSIDGTPDSQKASDDDSHIEDVWFMAGTLFIDSEGNASTTLDYCISILKLDMKLDESSTDSYHLKSIDFSASVDCFSLNWLVSYVDDDISIAPASNSSSVTVDISGSPEISSEDNYIVYLPIFSTGDIDAFFTVTAKTSEDVDLVLEFDAQILYPGNVYTKVVVFGSEEEIDYRYLADFFADSYPDYDTWTIYDETATTADFAGLSAALATVAKATPDREISLVFPNLTAIPNYAIFGTGTFSDTYDSSALVNLTADNATSIGDYSFYKCTSLEVVSITSATYVGYYAFYGCTSLTTVFLPELEDVELDDDAFTGCDNLGSVTYGGGGSGTSYGTGIGGFSGNNSLEKVEAVGTTEIWDYAFYNCTSLHSIDLSNVIKIGKYAFGNCKSLPSFDFPDAVSIDEGAFSGCSAIDNAELPVLTALSASMFEDCNSLTSVSLPQVTSVGSASFANCSSLTALEIGTGESIITKSSSSVVKVVSIAADAFEGTDTSKIDLTIGILNSDCVSGNTLTIGDFVAQFKSITVLGADASIGGFEEGATY